MQIQQEKSSKYEGHVRVKDWRNVDMKDCGKKKVNWDNVWYGVIVGLLFMAGSFSWLTIRENHPFNFEQAVQVPTVKNNTVQL